ncbi:hypothetical protein TUM4438_40040 [Shewanella sairae]|uniref:Uncharacterized protein n=1 Tax=Shewanella sairae TaxID=190310 RepID=A0ABQ4PQ82_9GAMM|nr:hypothetical protein TUM4438_40040 [Shewanella sairae]
MQVGVPHFAQNYYLANVTLKWNSALEQELRMLSTLHGIGGILLSVSNPLESELQLPAKKRPEIDWQ